MTKGLLIDDTITPVALIDSTGSAYGQTNRLPVDNQPAQLAGKGDVRYSLSTAVTLATAAGGSIPTGSTEVTITPEGGAIRFTRDSQNPTATLGIPVADGQSVQISATAANLALIKLFATSSTPINLQFKG